MLKEQNGNSYSGGIAGGYVDNPTSGAKPAVEQNQMLGFLRHCYCWLPGDVYGYTHFFEAYGGGLLVVFANNIDGVGKFSSQGSVVDTETIYGWTFGWGFGGGSVNVFFNNKSDQYHCEGLVEGKIAPIVNMVFSGSGTFTARLNIFRCFC